MSLIGICAVKTQKNMVIESLPDSMTLVGTPLFICKRGSFTVEAAIILPLLACFFSFILFFFEIMHIQLSVQSALEKTGRNLSFLAANEMRLEGENLETNNIELSHIGYLALAKAGIFSDLQEEDSIERYVNGGVTGISLFASEMEGDYIILDANYGIKFPVALLGEKIFWMNQRACFRKWTGWHVVDVDGKQEITVYVTTHGDVYHMRRSCPYLSLSIQKVKKEQVAVLRNLDGSKYKECKNCRVDASISTFVYITDYGERFHYDIECSGLKRTIYKKNLSEVEGKNPCAKCWK